MLKNISIILVFTGIVLLIFSLIPTKEICLRKRRILEGWKLLAILIMMFIVGYIMYAHMLLNGGVSFLEFIVSVILFLGSVFVTLVLRLSLNSIKSIEQLAQNERHRALHDQLTELPNRWLLQDRIDYAILVAKRRKETLAVLSMDLDQFKQINDSLGHFYGDYLLQEVADRLASTMRETDTLSRFGGDEFTVVLPSTTLEQAIMVCRKISTVIDQPFTIEGHNLNVGISIGIAMYPEHGQDSETLIQRADIAMYEAKRNDVIYAVFEPSQDASIWQRLILIGELRDALAKEQFTLHYQPKISVSGRRLIGVEALIRWQHPERGEIFPDAFIPLIEQAGLSKLLTNWVMNSALQQKALWDKEGVHLTISINLSVKNLHDLDFAKDVEKALQKWQVKAEHLYLEITESCMLIDPNRVNKVVEMLKETGVNLSIDDYGTGYSSLAYLRKFPAEEIKIDKSFVTNMLTNEDNAVIVKSTIDMIHNIGCKAVAEGVEDDATMELLARLGCDIVQGYHICRPLAGNNFGSWLDSTAWHIRNPDR